MTDEAPTPIVYVDANPFIYFIDGEETVANRLKPFFELLQGKPGHRNDQRVDLGRGLGKGKTRCATQLS